MRSGLTDTDDWGWNVSQVLLQRLDWHKALGRLKFVAGA